MVGPKGIGKIYFGYWDGSGGVQKLNLDIGVPILCKLRSSCRIVKTVGCSSRAVEQGVSVNDFISVKDWNKMICRMANKSSVSLHWLLCIAALFNCWEWLADAKVFRWNHLWDPSRSWPGSSEELELVKWGWTVIELPFMKVTSGSIVWRRCCFENIGARWQAKWEKWQSSSAHKSCTPKILVLHDGNEFNKTW